MSVAPLKVLVVDDEATILDSHKTILESLGATVITANSGAEALGILSNEDVDVAFVDWKMPTMDGLETGKKLGELHPDMVLVMVTVLAEREHVDEALEAGFHDYIIKPVVSEREFKTHLFKARFLREKLRSEHELRDFLDHSKVSGQPIIANSRVMDEVRDLIARVADTDSVVLIRGESGTGKELVADAIHHCSPRAKKPFVKVNCPALTETLIESELFGHEIGAFTNATRERQGRFELADGGSIFLDEISEIPNATQAKLLRVLQSLEFERVGGTRTLHVDVRIIAATNADLEARVQQGRFREDLYYRLNVVPIDVPPLRERSEDIPLLVRHFLMRFCHRHRFGKPSKQVSEDVLQALIRYDWPGNVRELENWVERVVILRTPDEIGLGYLPKGIQDPAPPPPPGPGEDPPETFRGQHMKVSISVSDAREAVEYITERWRAEVEKGKLGDFGKKGAPAAAVCLCFFRHLWPPRQAEGKSRRHYLRVFARGVEDSDNPHRNLSKTALSLLYDPKRDPTPALRAIQDCANEFWDWCEAHGLSWPEDIPGCAGDEQDPGGS